MGWVKIERPVWKRPNRIDRAAKRADHRHVRRRQTLLRRSRAATRRAVRHVTQDNQGKQPPGVDGVANLTPHERLDWVPHLHRQGHASPVRRGYLPKPGTTEPRPWGLPTMADRATQALVKHGLAPAGEAAFEPNRDGVRPGRTPWEAIGAIEGQINQQPTGVVDADIAPCVERLHHDAG